MEQWKEIEGYEGYYEVSNLGNVRSLNRKVLINRVDRGFRHKFKSHWLDIKGKDLKPSKSGTVLLCKDSKHKIMSISDLVAKHFNVYLDNNKTVEINGELQQILLDCCNALKISYEEMTSSKRGRVSIMRAAFAYYIDTHDGRFSHSDIGDVLKLDRSTVTYNLLKAKQIISTDKKLRGYVEILESAFINNPIIPRSVLFLKELKEKFPDKLDIINFVIEKIK